MGLWLSPVAVWVSRSGFLPCLLGVLLFIAGLACLAQCIPWLGSPAYRHVVHESAPQPRALELPAPPWLLIMGAEVRRLAD